MKETEQMLTELQEQHDSLTKLYETLQLEHSAVKEELRCLRNQHESRFSVGGSLPSGLGKGDEPWCEMVEPLFDAPVVCYELEGGDQKLVRDLSL
jgi:hypothetical protein